MAPSAGSQPRSQGTRLRPHRKHPPFLRGLRIAGVMDETSLPLSRPGLPAAAAEQTLRRAGTSDE